MREILVPGLGDSKRTKDLIPADPKALAWRWWERKAAVLKG